MNSSEIRDKFLKFFESKGHKIVPSASLIPVNDPSVLFTTAGMQQFKPYYLNPDSAPAKSVTSVQKCIRTSDIDEVGDDTHLTFFEMLGNFSFGGYGKKEAIEYAHEFITKGLNLTIDYVSVFKGEEGIPADTESESIWKAIDSNIIVKLSGRQDNFWGPTGDEGPCGPTTEIYVNGLEIWNIVFNQYFQTKNKKFQPLKFVGIDTGMGLERLLTVVQKIKNVYETDLFDGPIGKLNPEISTRDKRIILDHIRAATFLIDDGVIPSNKEQGYVLRRLMRRVITLEELYNKKNIDISPYLIIDEFVLKFKGIYNLEEKAIIQVWRNESDKFYKTLQLGLKELEKTEDLNAATAFRLYESFGLPFEVIKEVAGPKAQSLKREKFEEEFKKHQELSRTASAGQFKGGLADHSEKVVRLHTATHLLNAALRKVLGSEVWQKGSNITEERTRFDFTHKQKMTDEEKSEVEKLVNEWVKRDLRVKREEMSFDQAQNLGAIGVFGEKYPETVSVYTIYDPQSNAVVSREFCGGPHVEHTGAIGEVKIQKEEAVSAGVRRIKAIIN
ncbi:MAG: hypothetical protein A3I07_02870 [Candidatus Doudnabacteria bacterium RIFCSPLOWO2_02_FULL_42_9]|uniref:alanine--tRNA ligase n=1 Tax=Candidatus Doudnabacteria bacterium RIFCSPHIGHO2_01_FULL_41_86 TaxID=1817821 RepID=A0A1F5N7L6_9BACT|nr:MAG: hypothetical protein A2717_03320 [Candidatus Doudnabacteria bacterium RIFCSPHIGHO2_01_FULL_41_86]OGE75677.1 MAG: hypothetical protein A3K07_00370 [Candidatus Doudnabacteria bacterium RIFCSPHIGHO2_01_43_10]OGE85675.1 MAG: hypothetical protein A3E28_02650 [Candidatus Doudnabacteria bacterium RIFCSPHIGHO2_12_FULL_42_22]OGE87170.1 MAG: hypothetical protein A3C49_00280 [Candidatus Doudnabacteria bacterium RIFCSPHIGHO2_02_FULL_42_25]OGE92008.1 MAG: hypothetical protein A2895_00155 [Candidatus